MEIIINYKNYLIIMAAHNSIWQGYPYPEPIFIFMNQNYTILKEVESIIDKMIRDENFKTELKVILDDN